MDTRPTGSGSERFFKVFANLPINLRSEIAAVVDGNPVTWNVAYLEIGSHTRLGEEIVRKMIELNLV